MARILWCEADRPDELNTSIYRCRIPARLLADTGRHQCLGTHIYELLVPQYTPEFQSILDSSDIVVLERLLLSELWPIIDKLHKANKKVVAVFDDAYHLIPPSGGTPALTWRGGKNFEYGTKPDGQKKIGALLNEFRKTLRMVDTAIVPSRMLADDYRQFCPSIQYIPNVSPPALWADAKRRPPDNNFIIGWGGSSAHDISWNSSNIIPALGAICAKKPRVQIHLQTRDPKILVQLDKFNVRYNSFFWTTFEAWPRVVATFDIYAIPMYGEYDFRRSALKLVEAGMAHIPFVATDCPPYHDYGFGGILVENRIKAWTDAITRLIDDHDEYERLAQAGHEWALGLYNSAAEMYERALGF